MKRILASWPPLSKCFVGCAGNLVNLLSFLWISSLRCVLHILAKNGRHTWSVDIRTSSTVWPPAPSQEHQDTAWNPHVSFCNLRMETCWSKCWRLTTLSTRLNWARVCQLGVRLLLPRKPCQLITTSQLTQIPISFVVLKIFKQSFGLPESDAAKNAVTSGKYTH